jgi:hypothetical protein
MRASGRRRDEFRVGSLRRDRLSEGCAWACDGCAVAWSCYAVVSRLSGSAVESASRRKLRLGFVTLQAQGAEAEWSNRVLEDDIQDSI